MKFVCKSTVDMISLVGVFKSKGVYPSVVHTAPSRWVLDIPGEWHIQKATGENKQRVSDMGIGYNPHPEGLLRGTGPQAPMELDSLKRLYQLRRALKSRAWTNDIGETTDLHSIIEELIGLWEEFLKLTGEDVLNTGAGTVGDTKIPAYKAPAQLETPERISQRRS